MHKIAFEPTPPINYSYWLDRFFILVCSYDSKHMKMFSRLQCGISAVSEISTNSTNDHRKNVYFKWWHKMNWNLRLVLFVYNLKGSNDLIHLVRHMPSPQKTKKSAEVMPPPIFDSHDWKLHYSHVRTITCMFKFHVWVHFAHTISHSLFPISYIMSHSK